MNDPNRKPTILWVIQDNQISPIILDFLKLLKKGLGKINLQVLVPKDDANALKLAQPLNPLTFSSSRRVSERSFENFCRKRDLIHGTQFPGGLKYWQTLILDDLGEGLIMETILGLPSLTNVKGIILQIPTPLGSATKEEFIFNAWIRIAYENKVFIAGYELLPLYTRWTMIPSMLDGVITTNELSYDFLSGPDQKIKGRIWKLPRHEGKVFSPGTSALWRNGLEAPYHYKIKHKIPAKNIILYIAHNVAMSYEYKRLLDGIKTLGNRIHLMFSIGKDQIRGTHTHEEIIRTISSKTLDEFCSYSFHDLNAPWEMIMADAVLACSTCYCTIVAESNGIPCLVMDETVPEIENGYLKILTSNSKLLDELTGMIDSKARTTDITNIIYDIVNNKVEKLKI
ncbi:MAG: hypothetical protein GXP56_14745 [Deltaproteobacteria bacterium]|nr:hypothetical protein [Deltaproteobacteria bacterium]